MGGSLRSLVTIGFCPWSSIQIEDPLNSQKSLNHLIPSAVSVSLFFFFPIRSPQLCCCLPLVRPLTHTRKQVVKKGMKMEGEGVALGQQGGWMRGGRWPPLGRAGGCVDLGEGWPFDLGGKKTCTHALHMPSNLLPAASPCTPHPHPPSVLHTGCPAVSVRGDTGRTRAHYPRRSKASLYLAWECGFLLGVFFESSVDQPS